jgi:hypothetical protein
MYNRFEIIVPNTCDKYKLDKISKNTFIASRQSVK